MQYLIGTVLILFAAISALAQAPTDDELATAATQCKQHWREATVLNEPYIDSRGVRHDSLSAVPGSYDQGWESCAQIESEIAKRRAAASANQVNDVAKRLGGQ